MSNVLVPRTPERFLEALGADTDFRDSVLGDMAEEFELRLQLGGPGVARRWYYRECLRVAPYLLRNWFRNLRWRHLGYFGKVVLCSSLGTFALDRLLRFPVFMLLLEPKHVTLKTMPEAAIFVAFMLIWTLFDGCFAGYLAARIGRRAPLPSALLVAVTWMALKIGSGWDSVPPWFLALNVMMMVAGTIVGGTLPGLRPARTDCLRQPD
jgi:hypothetical protein